MKPILLLLLVFIFTNCQSETIITRNKLPGKTPTSANTPNTDNQTPAPEDDGNDDEDPVEEEEPPVAPEPFALTDGSSTAVYGIIGGTKICKWDPAANNGAGGWVKVTEDAPTGWKLSGKFKVVAEDKVYALLINDGETERQICMWNGKAWVQVVPPNAQVGPSFQLSPAGEIYAIFGFDICRWDVASSSWVPYTTNLSAALYVAHDFQIVPTTYDATAGQMGFDIYAILEDDQNQRKICKWAWGADNTVNSWTPVTPDSAAQTNSFWLVSETEIYATFGMKICKWDGTAWADVVNTVTTVEVSNMQFYGENNIYANLGTDQICWYDGTKWNKVSEGGTPGLHIASHKVVYAVIGKKICKWDDAGKTWVDITGDAPKDIGTFQFVSENKIYAVLWDATGKQICMFNGTAWVPVTTNNASMGDAFHISSSGRIYAVIGTKICYWANATWNDLPNPAAAPTGLSIKGEFTFISESEIYAALDDGAGKIKICQWDGTNWVPVTPDNDKMPAGIFHRTGDGDLYAVIGRQVCKWDSANGGSWKKLTEDAPGTFEIGSIDFKSETEIYAVFTGGADGNLICVWDGTTWRKYIDPNANLKPSIHRS